MQFCKAQRIRVIAANAPRRYVSLVSRQGEEGLKRLRLETLPLPLPPASAAYRRKLRETMRPLAGEGSCPFIGVKSAAVD